jgi:predicted peptidase
VGFPDASSNRWEFVRDWASIVSAIGLTLARAFSVETVEAQASHLPVHRPDIFYFHDPASSVVVPLPYQLLEPPRESAAASLPLLVFLHGAGASGYDGVDQMRNVPRSMFQTTWRRRYPCYVLVPQCEPTKNWLQVRPQLHALLEDLVRTYAIDRRRIYLTGFSMGCKGAWGLAADDPAMFAAVAPVFGNGNLDFAPRLRAVRIWCFHGGADTYVEPQEPRTMVRVIRQAGGHALYTELQGVAHDGWNTVYDNPDVLFKWMFNQSLM